MRDKLNFAAIIFCLMYSLLSNECLANEGNYLIRIIAYLTKGILPIKYFLL